MTRNDGHGKSDSRCETRDAGSEKIEVRNESLQSPVHGLQTRIQDSFAGYKFDDVIRQDEEEKRKKKKRSNKQQEPDSPEKEVKKPKNITIPPKTQQTQNNNNQQDFSIENQKDYWRIRGLNLEFGHKIVDISKMRILIDQTKTQNYEKFSIEEIKKGRYGILTMRDYFTIFDKLYDESGRSTQTREIETIAEHLGRTIYPAPTLTICDWRGRSNNQAEIYEPSPTQEHSIQVYRTKVEKSIGFIDQGVNTEAEVQMLCSILFGTFDTSRINEVIKWISGKNTRIECAPPEMLTKRKEVYMGTCAKHFNISTGHYNPPNIAHAIGIRPYTKEPET